MIKFCARSEFFQGSGQGRLAALATASALVTLITASPHAFAQIAPDLGTAHDFVVLSATPAGGGAVTCTTSTVNGDLGSTGGLSNTSCTFNGTNTLAIPDSPVVNDFNNAYGNLNSQNPTCSTLNGTLAGEAPVAGVYCLDASTKTGNLTLAGSADDIWVFKSFGGAGLVGTDFTVSMGGSADACNVYWWSEAGATMTTSDFKGSILAGDDITVTGNTLEGRTLAAGAVTMTDATLSFAGCAAPATVTVDKDFSDDNTDAVQVALSCSSGTVINSPLSASEAAAAVFTVAGADPGATCTATETVPAGYTADQTDCQTVPLGGACTMTNTLQPGNGNGEDDEDAAAIPTLPQWATLLLSGFLALSVFIVFRRRLGSED